MTDPVNKTTIRPKCPLGPDYGAQWEAKFACSEKSADAEQAAHLQWLAEFDRWEALTPRQREDEIRRAM